jgi:hypothetical protein
LPHADLDARPPPAMVKVFRFQYFDRQAHRLRESEDYATERAIQQMGAVPLLHTAVEVEEGRVGFSGLLKREKDEA